MLKINTENLEGEALLDEALHRVGTRLYDKNGNVKNFMVLMDDLLLVCNFYEFHDLMEFIVENQDKIFGGLTDERER